MVGQVNLSFYTASAAVVKEVLIRLGRPLTVVEGNHPDIYGRLALDGVCRLDMQCSDLDRFAPDLDEDRLNKLTNDLLGVQPAHQVIKTLPGGSYLATRVWCVVPNTLAKRMKDTAKKAIRKQMSTTCPGCLAMCVEFHTGEGLSVMADDQQNMLATVATSLLRNADHQHLAGVVFVSSPKMTRLTDTTVTGQSVVYAFDNRAGQYPNFGIQRLSLTNKPRVARARPGYRAHFIEVPLLADLCLPRPAETGQELPAGTG